MMKYYWVICLGLLFLACNQKTLNETKLKIDFTSEEQAILEEAKSLMQSSYYCILITVDAEGQPQARVVEPFPITEDFVIWMATNPKSRKVQQLEQNSKVTLHYFDKNKLGYVSLLGDAFLVNDAEIKSKIWKEGWEKFYPNKEEDYLLIKFLPHTLDMISALNGYTGDKNTWKPHQVKLRP